PRATNSVSSDEILSTMITSLETNGVAMIKDGRSYWVFPKRTLTNQARASFPATAPSDSTWLNPFGPLTTKAAKNAAAAIGKRASEASPRADIRPTLDLPPLTAEMRDSLRDFKK